MQIRKRVQHERFDLVMWDLWNIKLPYRPGHTLFDLANKMVVDERDGIEIWRSFKFYAKQEIIRKALEEQTGEK